MCSGVLRLIGQLKVKEGEIKVESDRETCGDIFFPLKEIESFT